MVGLEFSIQVFVCFVENVMFKVWFRLDMVIDYGFSSVYMFCDCCLAIWY
jgi:hypothetical protein